MDVLKAEALTISPPAPRTFSRKGPPSQLLLSIKDLEKGEALLIRCLEQDFSYSRQLVWGLTYNLRKGGRKFITRKLPEGVGLWRTK